MTTDEHGPSDDAPAAPPLVALEMVGDLEVGACVDGICEVPATAVPPETEPAG